MIIENMIFLTIGFCAGVVLIMTIDLIYRSNQ